MNIYFFVDDDDVLLLPPLSSLLVELLVVFVVLVELALFAEVTRVLLGVTLDPDETEAELDTTVAEAETDPEPEEEEELPPPPLLLLTLVTSVLLVFQYSTNFSSTSLAFLYASKSWNILHFSSILLFSKSPSRFVRSSGLKDLARYFVSMGSMKEVFSS